MAREISENAKTGIVGKPVTMTQKVTGIPSMEKRRQKSESAWLKLKKIQR